MRKHFFSAWVLAALVCFAAPHLLAQEIVHALSGTVRSIDTAGKTITLFQDSGSTATFKVMSSPNQRVALDKQLADQTTAATDFQKQGAYVILFYFGFDENKTAVALKNLGDGPFLATTGDVVKWSGHENTLTVRSKDGAIHPFKVDGQTVTETYTGAVNGTRFNAGKGQEVRVVSEVKDGNPTAVFIRED